MTGDEAPFATPLKGALILTMDDIYEDMSFNQMAQPAEDE